MEEKERCTIEQKRKKTSDYGEWVYLQKMKLFHAQYRDEYQENREYFSNKALHDSYEEEHIADILHKKCTGDECLVDKRRAELRKTVNK